MSFKAIKKRLPLLGIALVVVVGLYFATRLVNLTKLPVFVDEAIYIRWAQVMKHEPTLRFLPQSDGKQPLFMWAMIADFKLFHDPLFAGRFMSVLAGFGTLAGIGVLTYMLTNSVILASLAGGIYIFTPFAVFFDRMALVDSLLSTFGIWALIVGFLLIRKPRLDLGMILGFVMGGAVLTKFPGWYFLGLQPVLLLTLRHRPTKIYLAKLVGCWIVAGVIAFGFYNILRLGPNFNLLNSRNQDYVFTFGEVLQHPLNPFKGNITNTIAWLVNLVTLPGIVILLGALLNKRKRLVGTLFLWIALPLLFQASIAKVYTSRYFVFVIPAIAVLMTLAIETITRRSKLVAALLLGILVFAQVSYDQKLIFDIAHAPFPQNMAHGYLQEWTAGWGQKEVADYLRSHTGKTVVVGTEGYFGTLPDGLQIYTQDIPNLTVIGIGQPVGNIPDSLNNSLKQNDVYLVVNRSRNLLKPIDLARLELIAQYPKPPRPDGSQEALQFYKLTK